MMREIFRCKVVVPVEFSQTYSATELLLRFLYTDDRRGTIAVSLLIAGAVVWEYIPPMIDLTEAYNDKS